ncbi:MAG: hypothetical protein HQ477_02845 [Chloroflexi bacterium]|nr:hypothetical protein [Chloroflexota bacterium]
MSSATLGDVPLGQCCSSPTNVASVTATAAGVYFFVARAEIKDGNSAGMGYCQIAKNSSVFAEVGQNTEYQVYTGVVSLAAADTLTLYCQGNPAGYNARNPSIVAVKVG